MIGLRLRFRGLFLKYFLVLFLAVVVPLAANGISESWFGYGDQRAILDQLLGVEARSAAARIQSFLDGITNQLGWLVQFPWTDEPDERRRIDPCASSVRCPPSPASPLSIVRDASAFTFQGLASTGPRAALISPLRRR